MMAIAEEYIKETVGLPVHTQPLPTAELKKLPLFLRHQYALHKAQLAGRAVVFAHVGRAQHPTPEQMHRQAQQLEEHLEAVFVAVYNTMDAYTRKKLIQKRVNFLVPGKQLYIPALFIDLNESPPDRHAVRPKLSPATQCLLLYHLQVQSLENTSLQTIAGTLAYANMTITRAAKELATHGLCDITGGRKIQVRLRFGTSKRELWELALPLLGTPVKEKWYTDQLPDAQPLIKAGETALAAYSDLAESPVPVFAVSETTFKNMKSNLTLDPLEGKYLLEVWKYNPALLTSTGVADPLSVYLSVPPPADERVQMALEKMIDDRTW